MSLEIEIARYDPKYTAHRAPALIPRAHRAPSPSPSSAASRYSLEELISLGSSNPDLAPPAPASAKIGTVNDILLRDAADFLANGASPYTPSSALSMSQAHHLHLGNSSPLVGQPQKRSQTMPIVAASPMSGVPKTSSAYGYGCGTGVGYDYGFDHIGEGEEELDENTYDPHYSQSNGKKTPTTAPMPILLDFAASPIDAELDIDIDIELHSAKYPGPKRPSLSRHASANAAHAANANANNASTNVNSGSVSASASSVFNTPPGQMTGSPLSAEMAWSLSKQHVGLRHTATIDVGRSGSRSRSSSTSSEATIMACSPMAGSPADDDWRRPTIMAPKPQSLSQVQSQSPSQTSLNSGRLNAFAPPWPLPETTPKLVPTQPKTIATAAVPTSTPLPAARAESNTLPPPSSLPSKPIGSLPPVFVKREAALLPQGMALPHVPPMGQTWTGENALSGNDKRRRTSETGSGSSNISRGMSGLSIRSMSGAGFKGEGNVMGIGGASSAPSSRRPDKLVRLGERLKENANRPLF